MNQLRCAECGKFISYKEIEDGEAVSERSYAWDGEPIEDYWLHNKCK